MKFINTSLKNNDLYNTVRSKCRSITRKKVRHVLHHVEKELENKVDEVPHKVFFITNNGDYEN